MPAITLNGRFSISCNVYVEDYPDKYRYDYFNEYVKFLEPIVCNTAGDVLPQLLRKR